MSKLTESEVTDLEMVLYFWTEKDNPTKYVGWERVIRRHPNLAIAWTEYKTAVRRAEDAFTVAIGRCKDE